MKETGFRPKKEGNSDAEEDFEENQIVIFKLNDTMKILTDMNVHCDYSSRLFDSLLMLIEQTDINQSASIRMYASDLAKDSGKIVAAANDPQSVLCREMFTMDAVKLCGIVETVCETIEMYAFSKCNNLAVGINLPEFARKAYTEEDLSRKLAVTLKNQQDRITKLLYFNTQDDSRQRIDFDRFFTRLCQMVATDKSKLFNTSLTNHAASRNSLVIWTRICRNINLEFTLANVDDMECRRILQGLQRRTLEKLDAIAQGETIELTEYETIIRSHLYEVNFERYNLTD